MNVLGIDPGKNGAIVLLDSARRALYAELSRERFVIEGEYNEDAMAAALRELHGRFGIGLAILERQHAMPVLGGKKCPTCKKGAAQGATSSFSTGTGYGLWRGILAGLGLPREIVRAVDWQGELPKGQSDDPKVRAILSAQRAIPSLDLTPGACRVPQEGLADAGCRRRGSPMPGAWRCTASAACAPPRRRPCTVTRSRTCAGAGMRGYGRHERARIHFRAARMAQSAVAPLGSLRELRARAPAQPPHRALRAPRL